MSKQTLEMIKPVIEEVCRRSAVDKQFRQLTLASPRAAIETAAHGPIPAKVDVVFVENKPGCQTIVLPDSVNGLSELPEEELEEVAGGTATAADTTVSGGVKISW